MKKMDSISESAKVDESPIETMFAIRPMIYGY